MDNFDDKCAFFIRKHLNRDWLSPRAAHVAFHWFRHFSLFLSRESIVDVVLILIYWVDVRTSLMTEWKDAQTHRQQFRRPFSFFTATKDVGLMMALATVVFLLKEYSFFLFLLYWRFFGHRCPFETMTSCDALCRPNRP